MASLATSPATVCIALAPVLAERTADHAVASGRVEVCAVTVGEALEVLTAQFPDLQTLIWRGEEGLNPYLVIFLDDVDIRELSGLDTPLMDGQELAIITAVEGG